MQPVIRKLSAADAAALVQLSSRTFFDTFTGTCTEEDMQQYLEKTFNLAQLTSELEDANNLYYFVEVDGKPIAYLQMAEDNSVLDVTKNKKALEIKRIYVDKVGHGKGIAQMLMQFAEDYARTNQFEIMWLGVWEHNMRAKRFYEKTGFLDTGVTHDFPIGNTPQTDNYLWKFL